MDRPGDLASLQDAFAAAAVESRRRAPLYGRLAAGIADDPEIAGLLLAAPPPQRLPVLLFAAVHHLLLLDHRRDAPDHHDHDRDGGRGLARFYPDLVDDPDPSDPYPTFRAFCLDRRDEVERLVATRSTQTNEVGRCALLVPWLPAAAGPIALVDVGTSAGLNLALDRYHYRYDGLGDLGPPSTVELECGVRGDLVLPDGLPEVRARIGIDREPVDLDDPDRRTWLEACVWPDQRDRSERLRAAVDVARSLEREIRTGDAVEELGGAVRDASTVGHPIVMTTWVLNYLTADQRTAFVDVLDGFGRSTDLTWLLAESPALVPELGVDHDPERGSLTHVATRTWRGGERRDRTVATAHPHGYWLHAR